MKNHPNPLRHPDRGAEGQFIEGFDSEPEELELGQRYGLSESWDEGLETLAGASWERKRARGPKAKSYRWSKE